MDKLPSPDESPEAWREKMIRELSRRKIPRAWQARLLEELDDHLSDLTEETMMSTADPLPSPGQRLGTPHEIAAAAAAEYRKLGFFAQWPVLTYFALPIVATPAVFLAFLMLTIFLGGWSLYGAEYLLGSERKPLTNLVMNTVVATYVYASRFVPFALLAWWFCRWARRHGRGWRCSLSACLVAAVYAAIISINLRYRTESRPGALWMGFAIPPQELMNFLQAAVPLSVGLFFVWRTSAGRLSPNRSGSPSTASAQVAAG